MKCSICNGNLKYKDGVFVCDNCGSVQQISSTYQNYDVCIAYMENDEDGRRTKDSIIAQDIYNQLQEIKVNTFYERISIDNVTGTKYEEAIEIAVNTSKIIIVVGTSTDRLNSCLTKYNCVNRQQIIPIVSQMEAGELPQQLRSLQAISYDNVGAIADIKNITLKLLNRSSEIDAISSAKNYNLKKRKIAIITTAITFFVICCIGIFFVFCTPYVLDSKKYEYAQELSNEGNNVEAINQYLKIQGYKDSNEQANRIYDKYNGYFTNDNMPITLHLNIDDNKNALVEISNEIDGGIVTAKTEATVEGNNISFTYKDNQNNRGTGSITLLNAGLELKLTTENTSNISFGNIEQEYSFADRSDAPLSNDVTVDDLIDLLNKKALLDEVKGKGISLEFLVDLYPVGNSHYVYEVSNTNYGIMFVEIPNDGARMAGIYVPFRDAFPNKAFSYMPFILEDTAFIPYKACVSATNFVYEIYNIENNFDETTIFITTKDSTNRIWEGMWDEIVSSINRLNDYNSSSLAEYYLTSTTSGSTVYNDIEEAVNAAIEYDMTLVDKNDKVVFIP